MTSNQNQSTSNNDGPIPLTQQPQAIGHQQTEAHTGQVQDSLSYDKPDREEQVGGWEEGEDDEGESHKDSLGSVCSRGNGVETQQKES